MESGNFAYLNHFWITEWVFLTLFQGSYAGQWRSRARQRHVQDLVCTAVPGKTQLGYHY